MADNFLGEIRSVSFNFAPVGWALCDGQTLLISQNTALFALLGTQFGGDGRSNFALPNLQGRVAIHAGQGQSFYDIGETGGSDTHALTIAEIPNHHHYLTAVNVPATSPSPTVGPWAIPNAGGVVKELYSAPPNAFAASDIVGPTGASDPHENRQPFLVLNYIIALQGIFPSRN
jgi:microcystin-dependent protein